MADGKVIPHPDPILSSTGRFERASSFFGWLEEMTMGMWEIEKPTKKMRRKYIQVRVESPALMLEKLNLWKRLHEAGLRVAPTYTKGGCVTVFRLRFDCYHCATLFADRMTQKWKGGDNGSPEWSFGIGPSF